MSKLNAADQRYLDVLQELDTSKANLFLLLETYFRIRRSGCSPDVAFSALHVTIKTAQADMRRNEQEDE